MMTYLLLPPLALSAGRGCPAGLHFGCDAATHCVGVGIVQTAEQAELSKTGMAGLRVLHRPFCLREK